MKILILTPDIYTRGGIARYTATLASALGDLVGPDNVHVQPLLGTAVSAGDSTKYRYRVLNPVTVRLTTAAKVRFAVRALGLGRQKHNLIVCTHVALAPIAGLIQLLFGRPFWVTCHGVESWRHLPTAERVALRLAHKVLPISRFTAEKISETNAVPKNKISIVYNAVPDEFARLLASRDRDQISPPQNGQKKHLLSVGMLSKGLAYKGFDTVIRALPKVVETVPNLHYFVVGNGDNQANLKRLAVKMRVEDYVEFVGEVSDVDLAARYRACDVFVLPSRARQVNGYWEGEGFGRVYVEAALAGKAVVGSRDGGAAEAVLHGRTGLLVDPASVSEVADALVTLFNNPELAARMGSEGQRWARDNFTESALKRRLGDLLHGIRRARR